MRNDGVFGNHQIIESQTIVAYTWYYKISRQTIANQYALTWVQYSLIIVQHIYTYGAINSFLLKEQSLRFSKQKKWFTHYTAKSFVNWVQYSLVKSARYLHLRCNDFLFFFERQKKTSVRVEPWISYPNFKYFTWTTYTRIGIVAMIFYWGSNFCVSQIKKWLRHHIVNLFVLIWVQYRFVKSARYLHLWCNCVLLGEQSLCFPTQKVI